MDGKSTSPFFSFERFREQMEEQQMLVYKRLVAKLMWMFILCAILGGLTLIWALAPTDVYVLILRIGTGFTAITTLCIALGCLVGAIVFHHRFCKSKKKLYKEQNDAEDENEETSTD